MKKCLFHVAAALAISCAAAGLLHCHPSSGLVVNPQGEIFITDLSRGLLKIDAQGQATTVHKEGGQWLALMKSEARNPKRNGQRTTDQ